MPSHDFHSAHALYSVEDFRHRAKRDQSIMADLDRDILSASHGDFLLNPDVAEFLKTAKLRDAAVLVPLTSQGNIILTRRTEKLRKHSGQIAFAGGGVDHTDHDVIYAAKREAHEEISLAPEFVDVVGHLPLYRTLTGFSITPILAVLRDGYQLEANPDEVDEIFEVPLSFLMNPNMHQRDSRVWENKRRHFYALDYNDYRIWGVTAGIIRTLYERLYA